MKRIAYKKEPVLRVHRWIVAVGRLVKRENRWQTKHHYCATKKEVRAVVTSSPKGSVVEIYRAEHNFVEAWER